VVVGPAIVEEIDSTTTIHPGYQARIGEFGHMVLTGAEAKNEQT
jgi:N-methylhydantoinase A/oxoprolinase/acetone carboxylase beta subunit